MDTRIQRAATERPRCNVAWRFPMLAATAAWGIGACGGEPTSPPVQPGVAARLAVTTQPPASVASRASISPAVVVQVQDGNGAAVAEAGHTVTVQLASGSTGTLSGTLSVLTDATGKAAFANLSIAGTAGTRALNFTSSGLTGVTSSSFMLTAGPAAQLFPRSQLVQNGLLSQAVSSIPSVQIADLDGNAVASPGVSVTFAVAGGGGGVTGASTTTNLNGAATVGSWTLGGTAGANTLTATASGIATPLTFVATGYASLPVYSIELQFLAPLPTATQVATFAAAKARWEQAITGDLSDVVITAAAEPSCGNTALSSMAVDDLLIFVEVKPYDGPGNVLAASGPCAIRSSGTKLPVVGYMFYDQADIAATETAGVLNDVLTHEMGHVLGFGTLWEPIGPWTLNLLNTSGPTGVGFTGANAVGAYQTYNGGGVATVVPVEDTALVGTGRSHWEESLFGTELMTGWINGATRPLSATSIASMQDLGYSVNVAVADPFPGPPLAAARGAGGLALYMGNDIIRHRLQVIDPVTGRPIRSP